MSHLDLSAADPQRLHPGVGIAFAVFSLGVVLIVLIAPMLEARKAAIAEAEAWTIAGPPCPSLPPIEAARSPYQATKRFGYAGSNFGYVFGHVTCAQVHDNGGRDLFRGYPVCQFTSPAIVEVRTATTTAFFVPGLGRRTTVTVKDGVARCVMAGRFYGQNNF